MTRHRNIYRIGLLLMALAAEFSCRRKQTKIYRFQVIEQTADHVVFDVDYFYAGDHGDVAMSGITVRRRLPAPYWGFVPAPVPPGAHRTRLSIGVNPDAPRVYDSDDVVLSLYDARGTTFYEKTFPFKKTWTNSNPNAKAEGPPPAPAARLMSSDQGCVRLADDILANTVPVDDGTISRLVQCLP